METLTEGGNLHRPINEVWDGIARPGTVETQQQGKWPGPAQGSDLHLPPPLTLAGPLAAVLHALQMPVEVYMYPAG